MKDFGTVLGAKSVTKWLQELMIFWLDFWTDAGAQKEAPTFLNPSHPGPRGGDKGEGKPSPLGEEGFVDFLDCGNGVVEFLDCGNGEP